MIAALLAALVAAPLFTGAAGPFTSVGRPAAASAMVPAGLA